MIGASVIYYSRMNKESSTWITLFLIFFLLLAAGAAIFLFKNRTVSYAITLPSVPPANSMEFSYGVQPALSNPEFFGKVKQQFLNEKASFIEANLSTMKLSVYTRGELSLEVPINSKGKERSWWETPAGLYKVNSKEKAHFSGMGHVWMPWSLNFQGNFYIHGRTYYPDGTLTSAQYTGGCIRLATDDAEKVYNLVEVGMPVLVFEDSFALDNFTYTEATPILTSESFLAADLKNNHVFGSKDATKELPIASITKLVAALVTTEYINLDNSATVPASALIYTSKARLKAGQEYTIYQLLFPLLRESSNEAAETIARYYGREGFIKKMNEKAAAIGMLHSKFTDPSGANEGNISTAEDIFMLAKYICNNRSFIFDITSGKIVSSAYGTSGFADLGNYNDFITNPYFIGGKNGQTIAAMESNLTVYELPVNGTKRPIAIIVLRSQNAKTDGQALYDAVMRKM